MKSTNIRNLQKLTCRHELQFIVIEIFYSHGFAQQFIIMQKSLIIIGLNLWICYGRRPVIRVHFNQLLHVNNPLSSVHIMSISVYRFVYIIFITRKF